MLENEEKAVVSNYIYDNAVSFVQILFTMWPKPGDTLDQA